MTNENLEQRTQKRTRLGRLRPYLGFEGFGIKPLVISAIALTLGGTMFYSGLKEIVSLPVSSPLFMQCSQLEREVKDTVYRKYTVGESIARELARANLPHGACSLSPRTDEDLSRFIKYTQSEDNKDPEKIIQLAQNIYELKKNPGYEKEIESLIRNEKMPLSKLYGSAVPLSIGFSNLLMSFAFWRRKK
jgi:hypothetical protein